MDQPQKIEDNDLLIQPRKEYSKPTLTVLGKVSELTAASAPDGEEGSKAKAFTDDVTDEVIEEFGEDPILEETADSILE